MLDSITNPSGHVTDYVYDTMNRLLRTIDPENRTVEFSYDALSRVSTVKDPANVTAGTRTYTPNGMLASMKDARDNVTTMEYDGFDRLTKRIYPDTTFEWNEEYDANGNVTKARTRANQQILMVYDALNRMTSKEPVGTPVQTMTYDLAGRLKKISTPVVAGDPTSGDFEFSFDTAEEAGRKERRLCARC
jgi:YD repeat-containing protein